MAEAETQVSAYEQERLDNIRQNRELLMSLNLIGDDAAGLGAPAARKVAAPRGGGSSNSSDDGDEWVGANSGGGGNSVKRRSVALEPSRRSKRLRGEAADAVTEAEEQVVETGRAAALLAPADEVFDEAALGEAVRVTGHYSGWVERGVMERLGLEGSAAEAWESGGGGRFSFRDPLGTGKPVTRRSVPAGQSVAKYVASKQLKKNPNAYFYRHTEPGVAQWVGDWTREETETFIAVAREFGCGDKWGLFSTHIPHRVGYQCSNYYRQYVIPRGWVIDANYRIDGAGHAVYVGSHKRGGR